MAYQECENLNPVGVTHNTYNIPLLKVETQGKGVTMTGNGQKITLTFSHNIIAASLRLNFSDPAIMHAYKPMAFISRVSGNQVDVCYRSDVNVNLTIYVDGFYSDTYTVRT